MRVKIGVIGGTGVYNPDILNNVETKVITTPYGQIELTIGEYNGKKIAFLPRHGGGHTVPPHKINYRGNIAALKFIGVEKIIATAAVGSVNKDLEPGSLVLIDQFIDFTKNRPSTFFEGENGVLHIDLTNPYCPDLCKVIRNAAQEINLPINCGGTYVCTEGPRFETPAEISMFKQWGGDLVGMTSVPEVVLAREAEICYSSIATVTNYAAGISNNMLSHAELVETLSKNSENIQRLIIKTLDLITDERNCFCKSAAKELGIFN